MTKNQKHPLFPAAERLNNMSPTPKLEGLTIIGLAQDSEALHNMLSNLMMSSDQKAELDKVFPGFTDEFDDYADIEPELLAEVLVNTGRLGYLAEFHIPECDNFRFDHGKPVSWAVHNGICLIEHAYADTLDALLDVIEARVKAEFGEMVANSKKKTAKA